MSIPQEQRERIVQELDKRGVNNRCPRCAENRLTLLDDYACPVTVNESMGINLGQIIPCAAILCVNCGYVTLHALGILGLVPKGPSPSSNYEEEKA